jgi:hypothetical protein
VAEPEIEILDIIIDCADPASLATFWAELLGRPIAGAKGPYVWLHRPARAIGVGFQQVTHRRRARTASTSISVDPTSAQVRMRVEALGGRRVDGYESGGFLVMADPEGNEFCVVPREPFDFDEQGHTDYLDDIQL